MDAHAWEEQDRAKHEEANYQRSLSRARTGEGILASLQGHEAQAGPIAEAEQVTYERNLQRARERAVEGIGALARGGPAQARRPYLVGEKGPELMVPDQSGTVIPNNKLKMLARKPVPRLRGGRVYAGGEPEASALTAARREPGERAAAMRAPDLAKADLELGAPTSYAGGAGAPMPVSVVRGMRTTYTNPAPSNEGGGYNPNPSQNDQEFSTPVLAQQAFNRGQLNQDLALAKRPGMTPNMPALTEKYGAYVPPEGPKIEAVASADPTGERTYRLSQAKVQEATAAGEELGAAKAAFHTNFVGEHGEPDSKNPGSFKKPADPNLSRIYEEGKALIHTGMDPKAAYETIKPKIHEHYYTPDNVDKALDLIAQQTGQPVTKQWRANALAGTPEAKAVLYPFIKKAVQQVKPGFWASARKNVVSPAGPSGPSNLDYLAQ